VVIIVPPRSFPSCCRSPAHKATPSATQAHRLDVGGV
jgi:hypothetical protein